MTRTDRRRFLVLFAAIAALLALSGALALPLQAQTATTFVSNTGEAPGGNSRSIQAQSFTTGSNADGYTLSEVAVRHVSSISRDGTIVKVMSDNGSGRPGDLVADLDNPSSFTNNSILSFTAPASTGTLAADTVYWVVVNDGRAHGATNTTSVWRTDSSNETATAADPNWSIGNTRYWKNRATESWSASSSPLVFAIKGTAAGEAPTPSTDATLTDLVVNDGSSDLTLTPTFASGTETYTASVVQAVAEVTVTPTLGDSGATIEYLDGSDATLDDADTADDQQVTLAEGDNVIKVKVTAADGTATQTYTVMVNQAACTLNTGDLWCGVVTVEAFEDSGTTIGYGFLGTGALSDTEFSVGTNDYTIDDVWTGLNTFAGQLFFGLSGGNLTTADKPESTDGQGWTA